MISGVLWDAPLRAAVAAIGAGQHPPDSLAGKIQAYREQRRDELPASPDEDRALYDVLRWIGVKP